MLRILNNFSTFIISFLIHTYVSFYQWEIRFENWNIQILSVLKTGLLTFAS